MIVSVEAKFACDDCGTEFIVQLDPARESSADWTVMDVSEEVIRAGESYEDATGDIPVGSGSVGDDGRHYCQRCTKKMDAAE